MPIEFSLYRNVHCVRVKFDDISAIPIVSCTIVPGNAIFRVTRAQHHRVVQLAPSRVCSMQMCIMP